MDMRLVASALIATLVAAGSASCKRSESASARSTAPARKSSASASPEAVLRVHWLGKRRVAADTNAAGLMRVWNLPASTNLETQTFAKLSLAPARLLRGETNQLSATSHQPSASLLRPLLDDLVQEESFLEVRAATNLPGQFVLAMRLSDAHAALWQTNLAAALESLTGIHPEAAADHLGWSLKKHHSPNLLELTRSGDWTLFGAGQNTNSLLGETLVRLKRGQLPFDLRATNTWLEADADSQWLANAAGVAGAWSPPAGWPRIWLAASGDGESVRTRGELDFRKPLAPGLEPWNIPTNLLQEPLLSFTAVRGVEPWLASLPAWKQLPACPAPNQLFVWSQQGIPLQSYFAAPLPDATNWVQHVGEWLAQQFNPWLATNNAGNLHWSADEGVVWTGAPIMGPYLKPLVTNGGSFVFGGLFPPGGIGTAPAQMLQTVQAWSNLVYYDWEITGPRVEAVNFVLQTFRLAAHKAQLPPGSASMAWLETAKTNLGNSITAVTRTGPQQLSFLRQSAVGFTALELHLLADWLESPEFPRGLHSFVAPPPAAPGG